MIQKFVYLVTFPANVVSMAHVSLASAEHHLRKCGYPVFIDRDALESRNEWEQVGVVLPRDDSANQSPGSITRVLLLDLVAEK